MVSPRKKLNPPPYVYLIPNPRVTWIISVVGIQGNTPSFHHGQQYSRFSERLRKAGAAV